MKISGRKRWITFAAAAAAAAMTAAMSMTAFAQGYWVNDLSGWWYSTNEEGTAWYSNGWQWIDNDYDGIAECYYFDGSGCLVMGGVTPDGYEVSAGGAWMENGVVKTKEVTAEIPTDKAAESGYNEYGISNTAIAMLGRTKAENNALYAKLYVNEWSESVQYYNGITVYYDGGSPYGVAAIAPSAVIEGADDTIQGTEAVLEHAKGLGYTDAYADGAGDIIIEIPNYKINWGSTGGILMFSR